MTEVNILHRSVADVKGLPKSFSERRRNLLLIPRLYAPLASAEEGSAISQRYLDRMQSLVASLESGLRPAKDIYHQSLVESGEQRLNHLGVVDQRSHALIQGKCQAVATPEATEDEKALRDNLDLQLGLMLLFTSNKVAIGFHDWFTHGVRRCCGHISKPIDDTIGDGEVCLLVIKECCQVQFPQT